MRRFAAAVALAVAMAVVAVAPPALAQEQPPEPEDLRALAEQRRAAAAEQLERAQARLADLAGLRKASQERADDALLDATARQVATTKSELIDQLFRFERQRAALADAAAATTRLAEEAVDARLRYNDTHDPADRQEARQAEREAYEAAVEAVRLARQQLRDIGMAAGVETALVMLESAERDSPEVLDATEVYDSLIRERDAEALKALKQAQDALEAAQLAWVRGKQEEAERRRQARRPRHRPRRRAPRPSPRTRPPEPTVDELERRAALLREIAAELDKVAHNLTTEAAEAHKNDPERFPPRLHAAVRARLGAKRAEDEAAEIEATIEQLHGAADEDDGAPVGEQASGATGEPAPANEQPDDPASGKSDPATGDEPATALLSTGAEPATEPRTEPATGVAVGAGAEGGATVAPPQQLTAAMVDEHGLELVPPVPARMGQPGQEGKAAQDGQAPAVAPVPRTGPDDGADEAPAPLLPPKGDHHIGQGAAHSIDQGVHRVIDLGADLPSLDLPTDRPQPDEGIDPGPAGTPDQGPQLDLPALFEDHTLELDPPEFRREPPLGLDIEGGKLGPGSWPSGGPEPDAGIDLGPSGPVLLPVR